MKSLEYLNTHGQASVTVTDTRPATVIFNRVPPLRPINQISNITTTSVSVDPGIEIVEIIQGATADVRYEVKIVTGGSPTLASTITFPTLPSGVTQTLVGSTYTLSGIDTVAKWNTVKSFTWNLASNYDSCPLWFLEVSIIYYDGNAGQDKRSTWLVYDEDHYWVSQMSSAASVSANVFKVKTTSASVSASSTFTCSAAKVRNVVANLSSQASVTAEGSIMVASLLSTTTLTTNPKYNYRGSATISATATMSITPTYVYSNDLRFEIYHDAVRTTFTATVQTYQTNLTVFWGDGTSTNYTGTGDYRTHNISKTYTGTGYKDIKVAANAVTNFKPDRASNKCFIYKIYNWSRVPAVGNSYFNDNQYFNQIFLSQVPNYLPTNVTSMTGTFASCTSLNDANISSWNTTAMTAMISVFDGCTSFNQTVSTWNVSNCNSLNSLFKNCTSFNQPFAWTFKSGADLRSMLENCTGFNQDLGSITIGTSITLDNFLTGASNFSNTNYNKLIIRFANQTSGLGGFPRNVTLGVPAGVTETNIDYGVGSYPTGIAAYSYLTTSPRLWTITKG